MKEIKNEKRKEKMNELMKKRNYKDKCILWLFLFVSQQVRNKENVDIVKASRGGVKMLDPWDHTRFSFENSWIIISRNSQSPWEKTLCQYFSFIFFLLLNLENRLLFFQSTNGLKSFRYVSHIVYFADLQGTTKINQFYKWINKM